MKKTLMAIVIVLSFLSSCKKVERVSTEYLSNATILGKGIDCGNSYLIKFDSTVQGLPDNTIDNIYYEINLPDKYKVEGRRINVDFRMPRGDESIACTTLGISYPQIFIIKVRATEH